MSATNDSRMKHGTQSVPGEGAPVDSEEPTWRLVLVAASVWMLGYVCIIGASVLGWVLLIAALAGNRWALAGCVYAVTLSIACGLLVSAISNGSSDS